MRRIRDPKKFLATRKIPLNRMLRLGKLGGFFALIVFFWRKGLRGIEKRE